MQDPKDLQIVGAYLASRIDKDQLPKESVSRLRLLLEDEVFQNTESISLNDSEVVAAASEFIEDYDMQTLEEEARKANSTGAMAVDIAAISAVTAVWLLLQSEIEFKTDSSGKREFHFKKKAVPAGSLLKLFAFLRQALGF